MYTIKIKYFRSWSWYWKFNIFILKNNPKKLFVIEKDNDLAIILNENFKIKLNY